MDPALSLIRVSVTPSNAWRYRAADRLAVRWEGFCGLSRTPAPTAGIRDLQHRGGCQPPAMAPCLKGAVTGARDGDWGIRASPSPSHGPGAAGQNKIQLGRIRTMSGTDPPEHFCLRTKPSFILLAGDRRLTPPLAQGRQGRRLIVTRSHKGDDSHSHGGTPSVSFADSSPGWGAEDPCRGGPLSACGHFPRGEAWRIRAQRRRSGERPEPPGRSAADRRGS